MKSTLRNQQGSIAPLAIILVLLLVGAVGLAIYQSTKSKAVTNTPTPSTSVTPSPSATATTPPSASPVSDQSLIMAVVKAKCESGGAVFKTAQIEIQGDSGHASVGCGEGGYSDILKKQGASWVIVYEGQQPPDQATGEKYNLPKSWY